MSGFDFDQSKVNKRLITDLSDLSFTEHAHKVVLIGGTGTGKAHLAKDLGVKGITRHGRRVRFFSTIDLVNALEQDKEAGKQGKIAMSLLRVDLVILETGNDSYRFRHSTSAAKL